MASMTRRKVLDTGLACLVSATSSKVHSHDLGGTGPITATFVQPFAELRYRAAQWTELFSQLKNLGARAVYLQWSAAPTVGQLKAASLLEAAARTQMLVHFGLAKGHAPMSRLYATADSTRAALQELSEDARRVHETLAPQVVNSQVFAGWYIAEEVDDLMLQDEGRAAAWREHVVALARMLKNDNASAEISISTFVSGRMTPMAFADFWRVVWRQVPFLRVLLQDGFGVPFLQAGKIEDYMVALDQVRSVARGELGVVIETFEQLDGTPINSNPFRARPAPIGRLERQIALAKRVLPDAPRIAFSMPDYMLLARGDSAAALGKAYMERYIARP